MVKIGLEIHQQLNTNKLFCECPTTLVDKEPDMTFDRRLRPVISELGQIDRAALQEFKKGKKVNYYVNFENSCAVEWDEEPPHSMNKNALEITLQFVNLMNATPVDEIQVMRKILIDGSAVSGFQRTSLIATGGEVAGISIQAICLEEDSSRPVKNDKNLKIFSVDRLGTPLIEIATAPEITSGEQAKHVAKKIGENLRMLNVKRGIGTIRQDLNISIPEGTRVEIKGVQDLDLIPKLVDLEVSRQTHLVKLAPKLKTVRFTEIQDVSKIFTKTTSKIFKNKKIYANFVKDSAGLFAEKLHKDKHLGREIAEYVKANGFGGFIHSDENLEKYKMNDELARLKKQLKSSESDLLLISAGSKQPLDLIKERVGQLSNGVTEDTRSATPEGASMFLRPLPTGARMYPETDIPPIIPFKVEDVETPEERLENLKKILPDQIARKLHTSPDYYLFEELGQKPVIGFLLTQQIPALRRAGHNIQKEHLQKLLKVYNGETGGTLADLFRKVVLSEVVEKTEQVDGLVLKQFVKKLVSEKKDFVNNNPSAVKGLMGLVMKEFRGKFPGDEIMKIITEEVKKLK